MDLRANDNILELNKLRNAFLRIADSSQKRLLEQPTTTLDDVTDAMRVLTNALKTQRAGKTERVASNIATVIDRIAPIIDPLTQVYQPVAPVIWGSIRVLLQMTNAPKEAREAIVDSFIFIADNLPRISSYGDSNHAISSVFREIVHFLVSVAEFYGKHKLKKLIQSSAFANEIKDAKNRLVQNFRSVYDEVNATEIRSSKQENVVRSVTERLNPVNYEADLQRRREAWVEHTCTWTETHPMIGAWLSDSCHLEDSRLWLYGIPGSGKSIIAAYLIKSAPSDEAVVYFFCSREQTVKTPESILWALVTQLLQAADKSGYHEDLVKVADKISGHGSSWEFSVEELKGYLELLLKLFARSRFIVDGLDEYPKGVVQFIEVLQGLLDQPNFRTKVLILSRKEKHIEARLTTWPFVEIGSGGTTQQDVRHYLHKEVNRLTIEIPRLLKKKEDLEEKILTAAGSMFLYIRLAIENCIANKDYPHYFSEDILSRSPSGLDKMYEQYFITLLQRDTSGGGANQVALRALQWILFSKEQIPLTALGRLLAVRPGNCEVDDESYDVEPYRVKEMLSRSLGILIDFGWHSFGAYEYPILVHHSLGEYLSRLSDASDPTDPALQSLRDSIRPKTASLMNLATYSTVLCSPAYRTLLKTYYHCVDNRQWKFGQVGMWNNGEKIPEVDSKSMEKEIILVQFSQLKAVFDVKERPMQLLGFDDTLSVIHKRYNGGHRGFQVLEILPLLELRSELELIQRRRLEPTESLWRENRESVVLIQPLLHYQPLIAFIFGYFVRGLPSVTSHIGNHAQASPSFMMVVYTFLQQLADSASAVAKQLTKMRGPSIRVPREVVIATDAAHALQSLITTVSNIESLLQSVHPDLPIFGRSQAWLHHSDIPTLFRILRIYFCVNPETTFHPTVIQSLAKVQPFRERQSLKLRLALASLALENFRNIEFTLASLENAPVFGTNNFIYELRVTTATLARWIALRIALSLVTPDRQKLLELLTERRFLHSKLVRTYTCPPIANHHRDMILLDAELWRRYPSCLTIVWLSCFIAGAMWWLPPWLVIISIVTCSGRHLYSFQSNDPYVICRAMNSFQRFYILGLLISVRSDYGVYCVFLAALGIALHMNNLVHLRFHFGSHWDLHFRMETVSWRLQNMLKLLAGRLIMLDGAIWKNCEYGIASAAFGNAPINTWLNLIAVYLVVCGVIIFSLDPTGLERARVITQGIPHRFEELRPRMLALQSELQKACWEHTGIQVGARTSRGF